jgi:deoxyribonuclease-4
MAAILSGHRFIGVHAADDGGLPMAVARAAAAGARALQVFTAPPTYYNEKATFKVEKAAKVHAALATAGIERRHLLVHAAYVLNTATADEAKWQKARNGLAKELERSTVLEAGGFCFHPGSAGDGDPNEAAVRAGRAIVHALETVPETAGGTRVLIENTAGAGRTMGRSAEEIALMLAQVPAALRHRTGYGLDTCHLFSSGHDISSSRDALRGVFAYFERTIGERPAFLHLNDSQHPFGSNKDRHALVGEGMIGLEPFRWIMNESFSEGIPLILETPQERATVVEDDASADPFDARMVALLAGLIGT